MSLVARFPLNGNTSNLGSRVFSLSKEPTYDTSDGIVSATFSTCFNTAREYMTRETLPLKATDPISIFCWVCMTSYDMHEHGAQLNGIVSNHDYSSNSSTGSGFGLNLRNDGSSFSVSLSTSHSNGRTYTRYYGSTTFHINEWHHIGFTYDGLKIRLYLDGQAETIIDLGANTGKTYMNFTSSYDSNNPIGIGCWSTAYDHYGGNYKLRDVRVYNHCLSKVEIRNINRGLEAHYNFENLYKPVPFIESSGREYIDTGFVDTVNTKVEIDMQFTNIVTPQQRLFGHGYDSDTGSNVSFEAYINGSNKWARASKDGQGNWQTTNITATQARFRFILDNYYFKILSEDGSIVYNAANSSSVTRVNTDSMTLLARHDGSHAAYAKLYGCKIWDNEILVRDYIPVIRTLDGKPGLYDRVTGDFKTNQGPYEFTFSSTLAPYMLLNASVSGNFLAFNYPAYQYSNLPAVVKTAITNGYTYRGDNVALDGSHVKISTRWAWMKSIMGSLYRGFGVSVFPNTTSQNSTHFYDDHGDKSMSDAIKYLIRANSTMGSLYSADIASAANSAFATIFLNCLFTNNAIGNTHLPINNAAVINAILSNYNRSNTLTYNQISSYNNILYANGGTVYKLSISYDSKAQAWATNFSLQDGTSNSTDYKVIISKAIRQLVDFGLSFTNSQGTQYRVPLSLNTADTNTYVTIYDDKYTVTATNQGNVEEWGHRGLYSKDVYKRGFVAASPNQTTSHIMIGAATDTNYNYTTGYYMHTVGTNIECYELGTYKGVIGTYSVGDRFRVVWADGKIKYYLNDTLLRETTLSTNMGYNTSFHAGIVAHCDGRVDNISYGSLDDMISDASGYNNNGVGNNVSISNVDPKIGVHSLVFNGSSSYFKSGSISIPSTYSISVWAKTSSSNNQCLFCDRSNVASGPALFLLGGSQIRFDNIDKRILCNFTSNDGKWHHYVAVQDPNNDAHYIFADGQLLTPTDVLNPELNPGLSGFITFGGSHAEQYNGVTGNYLNGEIADWRLYSRALTSADVIDLYKTRFTIDDKYNIFCESVTTSPNSEIEFGKTGVLKVNKIAAAPDRRTSIDLVPEKYTVLDYIESSGGAYIKTGVIPTLNTGYKCDFMITTMTDNPSPCAAQTSGSDGRFGFIVGTSSENRRLWYGNNAWTEAVPDASCMINQKYSVSYNFLNDNMAIQDGIYMMPLIQRSSVAQFELPIFNDNIAGSFTNGAVKLTGRMYYFKISEGTRIIRDYIPAKRNSDGVIGLYDTITDVFYTNANDSGSFTAGCSNEILSLIKCNMIYTNSGASVTDSKPIDARYELLDFIRTNGSQRISTGITHLASSSVYYEFEHDIRFQNTGTRQLIGYNGNTGTYWGVNTSGMYEMEGATTISALDNKFHKIKYRAVTGSGSTLYIDDYGSTARTSNFTFAEGEYTLFQLNSGNFGCTCDLHHFRVNGMFGSGFSHYVRDMYPVRLLSDGRIGMYDIINNKFYSSGTSSAFMAGPVIGYIK